MTTVPPRGYGWHVVPETETRFAVVDAYTKTKVTTVPTRKAAWATVAAMSKARYATEEAA